MNIHVNVHPFLTIKDLAKVSPTNQEPCFRKNNGFPGAYIWGFSFDPNNIEKFDENTFIPNKNITDSDLHNPPKDCDYFFPYYIGADHTSVYRRAYEHLSTLRGSNYPIFDIGCCIKHNSKIRGIHTQYKSQCQKSYKNLAGRNYTQPPYPCELLYFPEGPNRYLDFYTNKRIQWQVDWMIRHFCITFIELDKNNIELDNNNIELDNNNIELDNNNIDALETHLGHLSYKNDLLQEHTFNQKLPISHYNSANQIYCANKKMSITNFCDLLQCQNLILTC